MGSDPHRSPEPSSAPRTLDLARMANAPRATCKPQCRGFTSFNHGLGPQLPGMRRPRAPGLLAGDLSRAGHTLPPWSFSRIVVRLSAATPSLPPVSAFALLRSVTVFPLLVCRLPALPVLFAFCRVCLFSARHTAMVWTRVYHEAYYHMGPGQHTRGESGTQAEQQPRIHGRTLAHLRGA